MHLLLQREPSTPTCTPGILSRDGEFLCHTLEDQIIADPVPETPENEAKVPGRTAIPAGHYQLVITYSRRFQRPLPLLLAVPGFQGIRIHGGNTAEDTAGCLLVGMVRDGEHLAVCRPAVGLVMREIQRAVDAGETVDLEIRDAPEAPDDG